MTIFPEKTPIPLTYNNVDVRIPENLVPLFTTESGLQYPDKPIKDKTEPVKLDTTNLPIKVYIENIDDLPPEQFAMARREGFGGSDSGILLGVNPYTPISKLIAQKARRELTAEEIATAKEPAVIKGNDLEPLIIKKFAQAFDMETIKPTDMYIFTEHPYLKMNFDGVTGTPKQYWPVEIKVVTQRGEHNYNPFCEIYNSREGHKLLPQNHAETNNSIHTKAELYGIPPYYYTQLQQEMLALNAPFGFLASLWESTWTLHVYLIHQDVKVQNAIKIAGFQTWQKVEVLRQKNGYYNK